MYDSVLLVYEAASWVIGSQHLFLDLQTSEDEGTLFLRKFVNHLPDDAGS